MMGRGMKCSRIPLPNKRLKERPENTEAQRPQRNSSAAGQRSRRSRQSTNFGGCCFASLPAGGKPNAM